MPNLSLAGPRIADADELLAFERENQSFFEANVNARPASYYSTAGVTLAIESAIAEAREDKAYQYLIRNEADVLIGRINLTRVRRAPFLSAELGYRIGRAMGGRGYASEAIRQVLSIAFQQKGLARIEAIARPENGGSLRVLQKNGFVLFGRSRRSFELAGVWHDRLYFERHADAPFVGQ